MYLRPIHTENDVATMQAFIRESPLGILISAIPSISQSSPHPVIQCSHIPWVLNTTDRAKDESGAHKSSNDSIDNNSRGLGILKGHMARVNPHVKDLIAQVQKTQGGSCNGSLEEEISILFNGPHSYITPRFYTETKPATGKVLPTWNYAAVQVYGRAKMLYDPLNPETDDYLQTQIQDLTQHNELKHNDKYALSPSASTIATADDASNAHLWRVSDAPVPYIAQMKRAIVGIEITIERLQGKWKMSQESKDGDRAGVIDGFNNLGGDLEIQMAQLISDRAHLKKASNPK